MRKIEDEGKGELDTVGDSKLEHDEGKERGKK